MNAQRHQTALAWRGAGHDDHEQQDDLTPSDVELLAKIARADYKARRRRSRYIDEALLGEPAWDILLDLFINTVQNRPVSVTSSALASQVPQTTALRYFSKLAEAGLVTREKSNTDRRVSFLKLTPKGYLQMVQVLRDRVSHCNG